MLKASEISKVFLQKGVLTVELIFQKIDFFNFIVWLEYDFLSSFWSFKTYRLKSLSDENIWIFIFHDSGWRVFRIFLCWFYLIFEFSIFFRKIFKKNSFHRKLLHIFCRSYLKWIYAIVETQLKILKEDLKSASSKESSNQKVNKFFI